MTAFGPVALALGAAWSVLVLWWAVTRRPASSRLRRLGPPAGRAVARPFRAPRRIRARLGGCLLRLVGCRASGRTAVRVGGSVLAALPMLVVLPAATVPAGLVGWLAPGMAECRRSSRGRRAVEASLPEVVDLLVLVLGAGMTVRQAVEAVGHRGRGPMARALADAAEEATRGLRLADALERVAERLGEPARPLVGVLVASERYGSPLGPALERLADEARRQRRQRAEEAARKIPVKLLFPLVSCTLPAFALLTVAPLIAGAIRSLRL